MKLFKRIRLKLGLFTRTELYDFAFLSANKYDNPYSINHADIENFIYDLKQ